MASTAPLLLLDEPDVSTLVTEDDVPVDNFPSEKQQRLLTESLYSSWEGPPLGEEGLPRPFLAAANVGLFIAPSQPPLVPDVFLSLDVKPREPLWDKKNRSYLVWEFGKIPELVVEIVSNREGEELGKKRRAYARMGIAYYVVYDPGHQLGKETLRVFELRGMIYAPIEPWFEPIGLGLIAWEGVFEDLPGSWLRWRRRDGTLVPTGAERAGQAEARVGQAEERAGQAEERAGQAEERARRLAERLRALGIDPDSEAG